MKKTTVTVSFDPEKLDALQLYLFRKGADLERELDDFLERSYKKVVPPGIRDFISAKQETPGTAERKLSNSASHPAKTEQVKSQVFGENCDFGEVRQE